MECAAPRISCRGGCPLVTHAVRGPLARGTGSYSLQVRSVPQANR